MSRSRTTDRSASEHQRGSAAVEFVLVAPLVLLIFAALVQIGIAVHVRATLVACAAEGARAGAEATDVESAALAGTRRALRSS
ncbi:MAG: TadE family protein, partial [Candidatus Nanopelagicales bacterium]